jgi:predicted AAA+ superfamily ATPase
MIERQITDKLRYLAQKFPIVTLTGPRQSGKSTLLKKCFSDYKYVSLEDTDMRLLASTDPHGFLATYNDRTIIDEAQRVPDLFSYIQTHVDEIGKEGMYILAGSHNFLLMQLISQSLAGRCAILKLLPFSHSEMQIGHILPADVNDEIFTGSYPRIYDKKINPIDYYPPYIQTYVERDVRQLKNIGDLSQFVRFIKLCAGRIGQLLNLSSLAGDCGIAVSTAKAWISLLETSYIVYLLKPDFNNYSKRLVKTPKLYFHDTGLACSLLGIKDASQLTLHYMRGELFENLVINEFIKSAYNSGIIPELTFWRDSTGTEIDLIRRNGSNVEAFEIKSGATFSTDYFKGISKWSALSGTSADNCRVIYNGDKLLRTSKGDVVPWYQIESIL